MDSDLSYWTVLAAANRWALYTLMLIGSGSALFVLLTPVPQRLRDAASTVGRHASLGAAFTYLASVGLGGAEIMAGGPETLWSADTWTLAACTSLGRLLRGRRNAAAGCGAHSEAGTAKEGGGLTAQSITALI